MKIIWLRPLVAVAERSSACELTQWDINVMSRKSVEKQQQKRACETFMDALDVDEDIAEVLVEEGFTALEEVAHVPLEEMLAIDGFDEDIAEMRSRAKDALLTQALASEEKLDTEPADDLLNMEGMEKHLAYLLASRGVITMDDLAEQSVDELLDIEGVDEERAAALIMKAREPWFAEVAQEEGK